MPLGLGGELSAFIPLELNLGVVLHPKPVEGFDSEAFFHMPED